MHYRNKNFLRISLALFSLLFFTQAAHCANEECKTVESLEIAVQNTRDEIKANEAKREASIDTQVKNLIAKGVWKESDRGSFFQALVASEKFQDAEKRKKPHLNYYTLQIKTAIFLTTKNPVGACDAAKDAISALIEVGKINQTQYDLMESSLGEKSKNKE